MNTTNPHHTIKGRTQKSTDPTPPTPLTSMRTAATTAGWACETIYALGHTKTHKQTHLYALRATRGKRKIVALWNSPADTQPLKWKFVYAGTNALWVAKKLNSTVPEIQPIPFTLSNLETKSLIKAPNTDMHIISDKQYEVLRIQGKEVRFTSETQFRTLHGKKSTIDLRKVTTAHGD
jgi:hypothetical protein